MAFIIILFAVGYGLSRLGSYAKANPAETISVVNAVRKIMSK